MSPSEFTLSSSAEEVIPSEFTLSSTAEEVTHGIDGSGLTAIVTGLHLHFYLPFNFVILLPFQTLNYYLSLIASVMFILGFKSIFYVLKVLS
jgi:hypothetical protein